MHGKKSAEVRGGVENGTRDKRSSWGAVNARASMQDLRYW